MAARKKSLRKFQDENYVVGIFAVFSQVKRKTCLVRSCCLFYPGPKTLYLLYLSLSSFIGRILKNEKENFHFWQKHESVNYHHRNFDCIKLDHILFLLSEGE